MWHCMVVLRDVPLSTACFVQLIVASYVLTTGRITADMECLLQRMLYNEHLVLSTYSGK